jgi:hypothetical protein
MIRDLELVKNILVGDTQYFVDHIISLNEMFDPLVSKSFVLLKGQLWRYMRK